MASLGKSTSPIGGVLKATASGSIANGKACILNSDGTVSQAALTEGMAINFCTNADLYTYFLASPYDASTTVDGSYYASAQNGNYRSTTGSQLSANTDSCQDISFKSDGTKFFVADSGADHTEGWIGEYTLSTAWDIRTLSFVDRYDVSSKSVYPYGLFVKPDGTEAYIAGYGTGDDLDQWTLSTAWDISTASFTRTHAVTETDEYRGGIAFKPDGTKMYIAGGIYGNPDTHDKVYVYSLSTAWDISSETYDSVALDFSSYGDAVHAILFNNDGTKLYLWDHNGQNMIIYSMSTAYDLSTASFVSEVSTYTNQILGMAWGAAGSANNTNFIGISDGAYTNGQTAKIKVIGAIDTNQSGLTPNALCYTNDAGTIVSSAGGATVGLALSPTSVLIKGPYDMLFD